MNTPSPAQALQEIQRVEGHVRAAERRYGAICLASGIGQPLFWAGMLFAPTLRPPVTLAWMLFTLVLCALMMRIGAKGRRLTQIMYWVAGGDLVLFLAPAALFFVYGPAPLSSSWTVPGAALCVASGLPMLYAAWRLMKTR
ncbi:hypothetical protein ACQP1V_02355 [Microtetraspora malaysiensis]|uniref:hypothetical protein n=1 Tax=Microtetraspora malaysiensis TaxID=161358 RepID=UPI003D89B95C